MRTTLAAIVITGLACCTGRAGATPPGLQVAPPRLPHGRVTIHSKSGPALFEVELALDPASHEKGLMFRQQVPEGTGMLFVFPEDGAHIFWMKNTLVPLDMIFLSAQGKVVGVIENTEPLTTAPRDPHAAARYVLEVAGGTAFAKGIRVGDKVDLDGAP